MKALGAFRFASSCSALNVARRMRTGTMAVLVLAFTAPAIADDNAAAAEKEKAEAQEEADQSAATAAKAAIRMIGATALVTEVSTGFSLPARVDTGATCCSIHYAQLEIKDAAEDPKTNIGKPVRILIQPPDGDGEWIETKIVDHVTVRTSESEDNRYKVRLKFRVDDVEKKVLVTLNDREKMKYPVLLGRNFLRDDFLVNVSLTNDQ